MIGETIDKLLAYSLSAGLIKSDDLFFCRNQLLTLLRQDDYFATPSQTKTPESLALILEQLTDYACQTGLIPDSPANRDLFDTALMGVLTPPPSVVNQTFRELHRLAPEDATRYLYKLSQDCNYIRRDRSVRDLRWVTSTGYGDLDITINLSKPEKDPRDIAAAKTHSAGGYPACVLCAENEGYAGRIDHPARQNLRIVPVDILGATWGLQYSPYVYYNEHCILLNRRHIPMVIDDSVFAKLFSFVSRFPHYFMGSNADLPIVGGSILSHEHFQGGCHEFAMTRAPIERHFQVPGFADVEAGIVKWPMSVIRLRHADPGKICVLASKILAAWRGWTDRQAFIFACTETTPHNTITPIARMKDGKYELDLVLRNNITTTAHPLGVYHPHEELHHIKKENIGLIEVLGLAVLPGRLAADIQTIKACILRGDDPVKDETIRKHAAWIQAWLPAYPDLSADNIDAVIRHEIGLVFEKVLTHVGVFARDAAGQAAFDRFTAHIL